MRHRIEKDAIGPVKVPADAYTGSFTARAAENFQLSGLTAPREFIVALGRIKYAAAELNMKLGVLDRKKGRAIMDASKEFIDGKFDSEFVLDFFQAGAGTPFHMNANEIIANRANELMSGKKGMYEYVHPNNDVNIGQSSNDVIPTAARLTALALLDRLHSELEELVGAFRKKAEEGKGILKVGRTHLEDAVPMTVEQEFTAFANMLDKTLLHLRTVSEVLLEVAIGGTAIGTGINTHPRFRNLMVKSLSDISGHHLSAAHDPIEMSSNMDAFALVSAALRQVAIDFIKISNDLKLLNMGPKAGIGEITLPEVEPGSSIMPGKVNPSVPEAVTMAACQVMGNDHAIAMCAQAGQLQLNVMTPTILFNITFSLQLLTNSAKMFREHCVEKLIINKERIKELFEGSLCTATALTPYLGYHETAELVNEALKKGKTIRKLVLEKGLLTEEELDKILDPDHTTKPAITDKTIVKKTKDSK